jgi:hypothetical protein
MIKFIKFTKGNSHQDKKQIINNANHVSYTSVFYVSHMFYHDFDTSYVLMRNKFDRVVALYVEHHHKRSKNYVWMSKYLVTNMR